jgi:hypothetical protein
MQSWIEGALFYMKRPCMRKSKDKKVEGTLKIVFWHIVRYPPDFPDAV